MKTCEILIRSVVRRKFGSKMLCTDQICVDNILFYVHQLCTLYVYSIICVIVVWYIYMQYIYIVHIHILHIYQLYILHCNFNILHLHITFIAILQWRFLSSSSQFYSYFRKVKFLQLHETIANEISNEIVNNISLMVRQYFILYDIGERTSLSGNVCAINSQPEPIN